MSWLNYSRTVWSTREQTLDPLGEQVLFIGTDKAFPFPLRPCDAQVAVATRC